MSTSSRRSIRSPFRRFRRFVVADQSMEPTLLDGQGIVGWRTDRVREGQLRCVEHPQRPGFWLVKRVESVEGATMRVVSDNLVVDAVDSRRFGPVPVAGSYRVVVTVPQRLM